jgi:hypothetical protein
MKIEPLRKPTAALEFVRRRAGNKRKMLGYFNEWFEVTYRNPSKRSGILVENYEAYGRIYFEPLKFYYYKYDPLTKLELDFYDKEPLMLSLGQIKGKRGLLEFGINFHFIPELLRRLILDLIFMQYEELIDINYKQIKLENANQQYIISPKIVYPNLKKVLKTTGWEFALRSYYHFQMRSVPKILSYEDWHKVIVLNSKEIIGKSPEEIQFLYKQNRRLKNLS